MINKKRRLTKKTCLRLLQSSFFFLLFLPLFAEPIDKLFPPYYYHYSILKNGKIVATLLGINHYIAYQRYNDVLKKLAKESEILVTELGRYSPEKEAFARFSAFTREELEKSSLILDSLDWIKILNDSSQTFLYQSVAPSIKHIWGLPPEQVHPSLIYAYLDEEIDLRKNTPTSLLGLDNYLTQYFEDKAKLVLALEDERDRLLSEFPEEEERISVLKKIRKIIDVKDLMENSRSIEKFNLQNIIRQNLKKTDDMDNGGIAPTCSSQEISIDEENDSTSSEMSEEITPETRNWLISRNKNWIKKLYDIFAQNMGKSIFIVVGMGHLRGEGGLLELLSKNGYIIEENIELSKKPSKN